MWRGGGGGKQGRCPEDLYQSPQTQLELTSRSYGQRLSFGCSEPEIFGTGFGVSQALNPQPLLAVCPFCFWLLLTEQ